MGKRCAIRTHTQANVQLVVRRLFEDFYYECAYHALLNESTRGAVDVKYNARVGAFVRLPAILSLASIRFDMPLVLSLMSWEHVMSKT